MDVAAEHLAAGLRVVAKQWRAGEPNEHGTRKQRFHGPVQAAALRAVALIHEDEQLAHGLARALLQLLDEGIEIRHAWPTELVDQRAEQPRLRLPELGHQVSTVLRAVDGFATLVEDPLDLRVQFLAVRDDEHAGMWQILQDPPSQQHHDDALAAACVCQMMPPR